MAKSNSSVREFHPGDRLHQFLLRICGLAVVGLFLLLVGFLVVLSWPAIKEFGATFLYTDYWSPVEESYGALPFIFGTIYTSMLALLFAAPISVASALFITELCPKSVSRYVKFFVEMLSAIPSIVYGLWALFTLGPFVRETMAPFIQDTLGLGDFFLFSGPSFGIGTLTASLVLGIMIVPTITSITVEVFKSVSPDLKHAALGIGATRWEMLKLAVLAPALSGIMGAVILGLGRALGETMAVAMVIGNNPEINFSVFSPASTMAGVLANEYAEASSDLHLGALTLIGLLLFLVSFTMNVCSRLFIWRVSRGPSKRARPLK